MKQLTLALLCAVFASQLWAQEIPEKKIQSTVSDVTVFLKSAQVTRKKTIDVPAGKSVLKFTGLSPFVDAKSIQVKADGKLTVLSVNHQQNFEEKPERSTTLKALDAKLKAVEDKILMENTHLGIIGEELDFLRTNKNLGGKDQSLSAANLREASIFYGTKLSTLKLKQVERTKTIDELKRQKTEIQNQMKTISGEKQFSTGEILVEVKAKTATRTKFEVAYVVGNAGWFPSYDIRAKNINEPVELIYKANIRQDTKVEWKNVKLKLSSSDPNVSGVAPELKTYFLNYNSLPPTYKAHIGEVSGIVTDEEGEPLPGTSVVIKGTSIGTITDFNGKYSISVPSDATELEFSFLGYNKYVRSINSETINVALTPNLQALEEVVVAGYGAERKRASHFFSRGKKDKAKAAAPIKIRGASSIPIQSKQVVNQTTVSFEIKTPYTIQSDNKKHTVDMTAYSLPAEYQYYCVPKVDTDAFLLANIVDWEKYNLLDGEANIFFEETFVGKSLLDLRSANDTLQISLGRDKNVSVKREKIKDFVDKQFIGTKKEETRGWRIAVRNNKQQAISMLLLDQIPVSTLDEIKVELLNSSGAEFDADAGKLTWKFKLEPKAKKELDLKYSVKYPKNRMLVIE